MGWEMFETFAICFIRERIRACRISVDHLLRASYYRRRVSRHDHQGFRKDLRQDSPLSVLAEHNAYANGSVHGAHHGCEEQRRQCELLHVLYRP